MNIRKFLCGILGSAMSFHINAYMYTWNCENLVCKLGKIGPGSPNPKSGVTTDTRGQGSPDSTTQAASHMHGLHTEQGKP